MNKESALLIGNAAFAGALAGLAYVQLDCPGAVVAITVSFWVGRMLRGKGRN